jgi:hypothetical protein
MLSGPKFAAAPDHAKLLHVLALCYAAEARTDGFVPAAVARKLTNARPSQFEAAIEHLTSVQPGCTNPSWEQHEGGWILHDYDYPLYGNPMKADHEVRREQKVKAGREGGKASAQARLEKHGTSQPIRMNTADLHHKSNTAQHETITTSTQNSAEPTEPSVSRPPKGRGVDKTREDREGSASTTDLVIPSTQDAAPLSSATEAEPEAPASKHPHAPASVGASVDSPSKPPPAPEAGPKLARAGAHAQPLPSLPHPSSPTTHGDPVTEVANDTAPKPAPTEVQHVKGWLFGKRGWNDVTRDTHLHEEAIAKQILSLGTPWSDLQHQLDAMWEQTDADDRPSSLAYFWTRLQDEAHARTKQQPPSHARNDSGTTKLSPVLPARSKQ